MSEHRTRAEVAGRSQGLCELGVGRAEEMSHRLAEGRGGDWSVANITHLSSFAHRWLTLNPAKAYAGGWFVETGVDPAQVPMWLARPYLGWWLVVEPGDGGPHILCPVDHVEAGLPAVPDLPTRRAA
jgi:hypothetical protein